MPYPNSLCYGLVTAVTIKCCRLALAPLQPHFTKESNVRGLSPGLSGLLILLTIVMPLAAQSRIVDRDLAARGLVEGDRGIAASNTQATRVLATMLQ